MSSTTTTSSLSRTRSLPTFPSHQELENQQINIQLENNEQRALEISVRESLKKKKEWQKRNHALPDFNEFAINCGSQTIDIRASNNFINMNSDNSILCLCRVVHSIYSRNIRLLKQYLARLNISLNIIVVKRRTEAHFHNILEPACDYFGPEAVELLIKFRASINNFKMLSQSRIPILFHVALSDCSDKFKKMEILIRAGANVDEYYDGEPLLQKLIKATIQRKRGFKGKETIRTLLLSGADVDILPGDGRGTDPRQRSLLLVANKAKLISLVRLFVYMGADPRVEGYLRMTPQSVNDAVLTRDAALTRMASNFDQCKNEALPKQFLDLAGAREATLTSRAMVCYFRSCRDNVSAILNAVLPRSLASIVHDYEPLSFIATSVRFDYQGFRHIFWKAVLFNCEEEDRRNGKQLQSPVSLNRKLHVLNSKR